MATITFPVVAEAAGRRLRDILHRILAAAIEARQREAEREIARMMVTFSDATLADLGLTREEVMGWHRRGGIAPREPD